MNIRQLRYFLVVASELHFGRAAQRLNIAQPPLSMQIKQLEKDLGVRLFERTKRRVNLTPAGEVLQMEGKMILQQLENAREKTRRASRGDIGKLSISFVGSAMCSVLPTWLQQFRQAYPDVELSLQEGTKAEQLESLQRQQTDLGLMRPPIEDSQVSQRLVLKEPLVAVLPSSHTMSGSSEVDITALSQDPFIFFSRTLAVDLYDKTIQFCQENGFSPNIVQTVEQLQTVLGLVSAQIGVAILPMAAQKLQREGVCYCQFTQSAPTADLMVVWHKDRLTKTAENFLALLT